MGRIMEPISVNHDHSWPVMLDYSDVFGQGILKIGQGKVSENLTFQSLWEPWIMTKQ